MPIPAVDHARWFLRTVRLLNNWPDVYRQKLTGQKAPERQLLHLRNGLRFEIAHMKRGLPILLEVLQRGVYAPALARVPKNPVVIDIGGHIGASTIFLWKNLPTARIYTYEPEPLNFELLQKNLQLNDATGRVTAFNKAVGGTEGTRTLYASGNSPLNSFFRDQGPGVEVQCTSLEGIFRDHGLDHCDLLKVDCEGAEYEILMEAPRDLLSKVGRIMLEWHGIPGHSPEELEQFLSGAGFSVRRPDRRYILAERA